ncbi:hypothetical protein JRW51_02015 [Mycoplasma sp. SG1]|nr:hypothetical protein JRW51_02015 [Mycoplasma sp. SG1]
MFLFIFFVCDVTVIFCFWLFKKIFFKQKPSNLITYFEKIKFDIPLNDWEYNDILNSFKKIKQSQSAKFYSEINSFYNNIESKGSNLKLSEYFSHLALISKIRLWIFIKLVFRIVFTCFVLAILITFLFLIHESLKGVKLIILVAFSVYFCYFLLNYFIKTATNIQKVIHYKRRIFSLEEKLISLENIISLNYNLSITTNNLVTSELHALKQYILSDIKQIREIIFQNLFIMIIVKKIVTKTPT